MKYRKKPVVVEAYKTDKEIVIHTLEGDMKASIGDYIITGVNGEQYPCKPDIFEKTYEAVTNTNYDKIKAMSVEEMAEMLLDESENNYTYCNYCNHQSYYAPHCSSTDFETDCRYAVKEWLNSEVEE